jgi:hypothetical protein
VLFRNAEAIEVMRKVDTLVVDKPGTLTEGKPRLVTVLPAAGSDEATLLRLAATLERGSEHPLAAAIVQGSEARGVELASVSGFEGLTGKGVRGTVDGRAVALGNRALMSDLGVALRPLAERAGTLRGEGQTVVFVAVGREPAEAVARRLRLDDVVAEVLPDQKADVVKRLQREGRFVAMAGDGINDAPALAQAQVGIAMGIGTDVAMERAPVTLVKGDVPQEAVGAEGRVVGVDRLDASARPESVAEEERETEGDQRPEATTGRPSAASISRARGRGHRDQLADLHRLGRLHGDLPRDPDRRRHERGAAARCARSRDPRPPRRHRPGREPGAGALLRSREACRGARRERPG